MAKLRGTQKYQLCVDYIEANKADLLHSRPKMNDLIALVRAKAKLDDDDKLSSGHMGDAIEHVYGDGKRSFRSADKSSAFSELQNTCNHMIGWIIKLIETGELADWVVNDLRADKKLPDDIRNAEPRTTLCVKKTG